jgi:peptide methionine sulfoxide reductase msrA/msrB
MKNSRHWTYVFIAVCVVVAIGLAILPRAAMQARAEGKPQESKANNAKQPASAQVAAAKKEAVGKVEKTDAEWKKVLTPEQFYIMRREGTEHPFSGDYHPKNEPGIFRCAACGLSLYDGATEFHSGTGWPSFYQPIAKNHVIEKTDADGMRTEVECARCGGHLGHVFNDGPQPTGLRYCMNSPALKFISDASVAEKTATNASEKKLQKATFGAGCFWSMEAIYSQLKGVTKVEPGYAGGTAPNPTYEQVGSGQTGYAETIDVTFDPKVISYRELLDVLFTVHDPTTLNRQGADVGTQYRSVIFYHDDAQKSEAENFIKQLSAEKVFADPIVTQVQPFKGFYRAEDYHLNYYSKNPNQGYCRVVIAPKIEKFHKKFRDKLKS